MRLRHLATPTLLTLLATGLAAQTAFTPLAPTSSPTPRAGMMGVSDGVLAYLFGGKPSSTTETNDMWVFTGTDWLNATPAGPLPPARDWYGAAFDRARGRYVLFGGRSTQLGGNLGDTWEFDGATWTQRTPAVAPSARRWCAMAYDADAGVCVLFGGEDGGVYGNETWTWDGAVWTLLSPSTSPSVRGRGRLSYDPTTATAIYFGGRDAGGALADTWRWDGADWAQVPTQNAPNSAGVAGRFAYGMTFDELRQRHVLFGGTRNGPVLSDTWEFDGLDWTLRAPGNPPARTGPFVAYVDALQETVVFGGYGSTQLGDTWSYQTTSIATTANYGAGCPGPGGALQLTTSTRPWTDAVWSADAGALGGSSIGVAVWSAQQAMVPLNPVLSLAPIGCDLLVGLDLIVGPWLPVAGVVTTQFAIPDVPAAAGATVYVQVAELELGASGTWVGLYTSDAIALTIGVR